MTTNGQRMMTVQHELVQVQSTPDRGHIVVTQQEVDPGEILIQEPPLMSVPRRQIISHPSISEHNVAAAVAFFSQPPDVQARVCALHAPQPLSSYPMADVVLVVFTELQAAGELDVAADPDVFLRVYCVFALNARAGCEGSLHLFELGDRINHSCLPNARHSGSGDVRAIAAIEAGAEVTVSYLDDDVLMLPTHIRRSRLRETWHFECCCVQCASSIELSCGFKCASCTGRVQVDKGAGGGAICVQCGQGSPELDRDAEKRLVDSLPWIEWIGVAPVLQLLDEVSLDQIEAVLGSEDVAVLHCTHWAVSLLHFLCALHHLTRGGDYGAAICHLQIRIVAWRVMFEDVAINATACLWEYLGDANLHLVQLEDAVQCYESSWRLTTILFGKQHGDTKCVKAKLKIARSRRPNHENRR